MKDIDNLEARGMRLEASPSSEDHNDASETVVSKLAVKKLQFQGAAHSSVDERFLPVRGRTLPPNNFFNDADALLKGQQVSTHQGVMVQTERSDVQTVFSAVNAASVLPSSDELHVQYVKQSVPLLSSLNSIELCLLAEKDEIPSRARQVFVVLAGSLRPLNTAIDLLTTIPYSDFGPAGSLLDCDEIILVVVKCNRSIDDDFTA